MRYASSIERIIAKGYFWMIFEFDNGFIAKVDFSKPTVNLRSKIMIKENFDKKHYIEDSLNYLLHVKLDVFLIIQYFFQLSTL